MADHTLDAKGLNCPLPILKARKALKDVAAGETLEILSTDPGSVADFQAFCRQDRSLTSRHSADRRAMNCWSRPMTIRCFDS